MTMKTTVLTIATLLLAVATSFAGGATAYHPVRFRGTLETASGVQRFTEADFVGPGNFLVAGYDLLSNFDFLSLQEWSDTNADGAPDTFVRIVFVQTHSAVLPNNKFAVNLSDGLGVSAFSVSGKVKVKDGVQTGFSAKVTGAQDSQVSSAAADGVFKGTLITSGKVGGS
jgi:hypothetical protein